ncbi:hypothetical protein JOQ06_007559, partial [Pogonophryne albipinna]
NEIDVQTDPPPRIHHKSMQARPRFRSAGQQVRIHVGCSKERTRGEDVYKAFKDYVREYKIPIHKIVSFTTDELDSVYGDLILHADVRWLSRGKVLQRFLDLLPEIISFLKSRNEEYEQLSDDTWLLDLGFLTDLTAKLNDLNRELQGKDREL